MRKYIEAEELKTFMRTMLTGNDLYKPNGIDEFVDGLLAADVEEVRHGYWINDNHLIKCSICEKPIPLRRVVLHGEVMWEDNSPVKYCPNCGAKMDLEGDAE